MAIVKKEDTVAGMSSKIALPRDRYLIQCTKQKFGPSSTGNPMFTLEWQIQSPDVLDIGGQKTTIGGQKVTQYLPTKVKGEDGGWDAEKSAKAMGRLIATCEALGIDVSQGIDDENPDVKFEGIYADALLAAEESVARKAPTPEQKSRREQGDPILGADNKPIKSYRIRLESILGKAAEQQPV